MLPGGAVSSMATDPILELRHVSKAFGHVVALADVSLQAHAGSVLVIVGDNGAVKSTMIKVLAGVFPVDTGEVRFDGRTVALASPAKALMM